MIRRLRLNQALCFFNKVKHERLIMYKMLPIIKATIITLSITCHGTQLHAQQCPSTFILEYTNTTYDTIMSSLATMLNQLQRFSAPQTELFPSYDELVTMLNTKSGAITCAWPRYPGTGHMINKEETAQLETIMEYYFRCRGLQFVGADGYYDGYTIPNSYIVFDITEEEMTALAKSFAQYSILVFNGQKAKLMFLWGENKNHFYAADNWVEMPDAQSNYTAVPIENTLFKFHYNFDFNKLLH